MAKNIVTNWEEARDIFRKWRETNARNSEETVEVWESLLQRNASKLGDEAYLVYEQVFVAALDCGSHRCAQKCLKQLQRQFPDSNRVNKLIAMQCEALGRFEEAEKVYNKILKADETNGVIRKRLIALYKAQGKHVDAINELNKYLKKFQSDYEAWGELCELYCREQDLGKAAFCMEELIMSSPYNHLYHQRYADIKYSAGGVENMELARSYYSQALHLNPGNMRALYGLFLSANNIAAAPRSTGKRKKDNTEYAQWALKQICLHSRDAAAPGSHDDFTVITKSLAHLQVT